MINLMQGDCLERMKEIPDGSVDLVLTDPPYGTTQCKWDSVIPFEPMWEQVWRVLKPNGFAVLFCAQPFTSALIMSNVKNFKYDWSWDKKLSTGGALAKKKPMRAHEDIAVFSRGSICYNPQMTAWTDAEQKRMRRSDYTAPKNTDHLYSAHIVEGKGKRLARGKYPQSVLRINGLGRGSREAGKHPTQKPVALMEYLIKTYTSEGETVLDFTMGSGTTGVAAKDLNRSFIGIEMEEKYFKIAKERIESSNPLGDFLE